MYHAKGFSPQIKRDDKSENLLFDRNERFLQIDH